MATQNDPPPRTSEAVLNDWREGIFNPKLTAHSTTLLIDRHNREQPLFDPAFPERLFRIEPLPDRRGDILIVKGEILVHATDADRATPLLLNRGFVGPETLNCGGAVTVDLPVVVYRRKEVQGETSQDRVDALRAAVKALTTKQINASFNHVLPDGKAKNGVTGPAHAANPPVPPANVDPSAGTGVTVAVIDTGMWADGPTRPDGILAGIAVDASNKDGLRLINQGEVPPTQYLDLGAGHGTFVAGVVRQIAPAADIRMYRALDSDGIGSEIGVACAILRAASDGATIINLSLGSESYLDRPPVALDAALRLIPDDVVVVASAGNLTSVPKGQTRPHWPAAFRRVIAVGGLDRNYKPAKWSQRGHWVDVSTWGENVTSTYVIGDEQAHPEFNPTPDVWPADDFTPWATWTGTSFAAPQISGLLAAGTPARASGQRADPRVALTSLLAQNAWHVEKFGTVIRTSLLP